MWANIFGKIVADAGYVGVDIRKKGLDLGKHLVTCVRKNMKKVMTQAEHTLTKVRQCVETVFSVLKLRFGMESTLSRSEKGILCSLHLVPYCVSV